MTRPMVDGTPTFALERDGNQVASGTGKVAITMAPTACAVYNYNAGE